LECRPIQYDGGAGSSVVSEVFARAQRMKRYLRKKATKVSGYDGSETLVTHYVVVEIGVIGTDCFGQIVKRTFKTQALVVPRLDVDFLLGSNVADRHNIVVIPDERTTTMFRGEDKITIKCMKWSQVQRHMIERQKKTNTSVSAVGVNSMEETPEHKMLKDLEKRVEEWLQEPELENKNHRAEKILDEMLEDPRLFARMGTKFIEDRYYLAALTLAAQRQQGLEEWIKKSLSVLTDAIMNKDKTEVISQRVLDIRIADEELKRAISMVKMALECRLLSHPKANKPSLTIRTMQVAAETFNEETLKEQEEYELSVDNLKEITTTHATRTMWDMKPPEFSTELWPYVFDFEKPKVKARFKAFDVDKERKAQVIQSILDIEVSEESRGRKLEKPLFQAMFLACIDKFEHPDPKFIPTIKDKEFKIELKDDDQEPCVARYQKFDAWQTRYLYINVRELIKDGKAEVSDSEWNSRLQLVPYTDRIQKFIKTHGLNVLEALHSEEFAKEVNTFFRMTMDMRPLNAKTKRMIFPLPSIAEILDKCGGSERFTTSDVKNAFWCVRAEMITKLYSAFSTPEGHFHLTVMPQGAKNAATYWAKIIADIFQELNDQNRPIFIYQDDIGNRAKELLEHLLTQYEIFDVLGKNYMVFKTTKTRGNFKTQRILGQVMNKGGRTPDPKIIAAVTELKRPSTLKEVRAILGLFQFCREYIENMSLIMQPIQDLAKKGVDIQGEWKEEVH
jgi:hypothetical protein